MRMFIARTALYCLSIAAIVIGIMIYTVGPHFTASFFSTILSYITGHIPNIDDLSNSNIGSEMRFFAVFWIAYGWVVFLANQKITKDKSMAYYVLALFFAGGVGRIISVVFDGTPDTLFVVLMWVELVSPPIVACLLLTSNKKKERI